MIDLILSLIGGLKGLLAGAVGLFGVAWLWWSRRRNKQQQATIAKQDRAISIYKVKEEIHRQDGQTDAETYKKILELEEKVDHAKSPEDGAGEVSGAINDYFKQVHK